MIDTRAHGAWRLLARWTLFSAMLCVGLSAGIHAETRFANISQGTNIAIDVSPDGEWLIVDLLGRLFRLPSSGGAAEQITPDDEAARHPRFSPTGRQVVYQRLVDGQWDLWLLDTETSARKPLIATSADEREPHFTADGRAVVFVSDRAGPASLWRIDIETGIETQLTAESGEASFPAVSERDEVLYVLRDGARWSLRVLLPSARTVEVLVSSNRLSAPTWRPGGGVVVYNEQAAGADGRPHSSELKMLMLADVPLSRTLTRGEDVFASRAAWSSRSQYYYAADGRIWRRGIAHATRDAVHLFAAVAVDTIVPDRFDARLDAPGPNPVLGAAGRGTSADGKTEVIAALGDLWLVDQRGRYRRLTDDAFVETDPAVAPNGEFVVFASDRGGQMDLWHAALPSGVLTQLTFTPAKAFAPALSPNGREVAWLETDGLGTLGAARLNVLNLSDRRPRPLGDELVAPVNLRWSDTTTIDIEARGYAGAVHSTALRLSVDAASGRVETDSRAGPAAGPLAAPPATGGSGPLPLEWSPAAAAEPYVVQVGRLFDGIDGRYRRHVDVHVTGQRITAITGRDLGPPAARVIDLRDATMIPGLIDIHARHSSILGERLGRIWLAHGVTTVREVTHDVDRALERAESWASGRRAGPRLLISPDDRTDVPPPPGGAAPPAAESAGARLFTPIPVRRFSGLASAATLFGGAEAASGYRASAYDRDRSGDEIARSALGLSYDDVFSVLAASRTVVATSLSALGARPGDARARQRLTHHPSFLRLFTPDERAAWQLDSSGTVSAALQQNVARLVRAGGQVAAAAESPTVPYGLGVHLELAMLADAGLPNEQVLTIATSGNALALGLEAQLGTLEEGKLADFVVVDGDPLVDLSSALDIIGVARGGVWFDASELTGG